MPEKTSRRGALGQGGEKPSLFGMQRRDLCVAAGGILGLLALGAAGRSGGTSAPAIRPPGGQDESEFIARCIRCDRCRSVCHTSVIGVGTIAGGLTQMRTPVMNYVRGDCDFCHKCVNVCPTQALHDFDPKTAKIGTAELTDICIALRTGGCTKCYELCPYDAISLSETNAPIIDANRCNGCGTCVNVCPANVFQSFKGETVRGIRIVPDAQTVRGDATERDTTPNPLPERSKSAGKTAKAASPSDPAVREGQS